MIDLNISHNNITELPLHNRISSETSVWYPNLETLNISHNPIKYIDKYITSYTKLKSIDFTNLSGTGTSYFYSGATI